MAARLSKNLFLSKFPAFTGLSDYSKEIPEFRVDIPELGRIISVWTREPREPKPETTMKIQETKTLKTYFRNDPRFVVPQRLL